MPVCNFFVSVAHKQYTLSCTQIARHLGLVPLSMLLRPSVSLALLFGDEDRLAGRWVLGGRGSGTGYLSE